MRETGCNKTSKRRYYLKILEIIVTALIALNILLSGTALAKTITVDAGGSGDYTSIQDAIDNSIEYDDYGYGYVEVCYPSDLTIIVYPGVYNESIKILYSVKIIASSSNPADTVIESEGYAIDLLGQEQLGEFLISGFTIKGADEGIHDGRYGHTLEYLTIENNIINGGNFGINLLSERPTIKNNTFSDNGLGICLDNSGPVNIIDNEFIENGAGIYTGWSNADIKNNLFTNNNVAIDTGGGGVQIIQNIIRDNTVGITASPGSFVVITSNIITGNAEYGIDCHTGARIYNNNLNNNINVLCYDALVFNTTLSEGPNIMGGPYIGGNFWGKPDGTGFSQTHADANSDGFCDEPYVHNDYFAGYSYYDYAVDYLPLKEKVSPLEPVLPAANFSNNLTEGYAPLSVQFIDLSENATEWKWDFGDGDISADQNTTHIYSTVGTYTVTLTVSNSKGTDSKTAVITVLEPQVIPAANFSASLVTGKAPLTVIFTDKSTGSPTSWFWNFGDKSTSIDQNPVHTYNKAGKYTVSLTVKNTLGNNTKKIKKYIVVTNK